MIDTPAYRPNRLAAAIAHGLCQFGCYPGSGAVALLGPIRRYTATSADFLRRITALKHVGWRAPVIHDGAAIAIASWGKTARDGISVRSGDSATAFKTALDLAIAKASQDKDAVIRFMTLRDLFIRAVWIKTPRHSLWIPVRVGTERVRPDVLATRAFKALVRKRMRAVALSPAQAHQLAVAQSSHALPPGGYCAHVRKGKRLVPIKRFLAKAAAAKAARPAKPKRRRRPQGGVTSTSSLPKLPPE
jgi:hypothetical protein